MQLKGRNYLFGNRNWHIEWYLLKQARHTCMEIEKSGQERELKFIFGIYWLFTVYLTFYTRLVPGYNGKLEDLDRTLGWSWFSGSLWLYLWTDRSGYGPDRTYCFTPMDFFFGRTKSERRIVATGLKCQMELPEGKYDLVASKEWVKHTRPRLPFWKREYFMYDIETVDQQRGIPEPGKGESEWDLDDDASFSVAGRADSLDELIARWKESIMRRRNQYGGTNWQPN